MPTRISPLVIIITTFTLLADPASAFNATLIDCHDGDTCTIVPDTTNDRPIHIRIHAIDAPEMDQPFGPEARAVILSLIPPGTHVDIRPTGDYSYNRMVADIVRDDGVDVGAEMIAEGAAWNEPRWANNADAPWLQAQAQAAHRGLWAEMDPVLPWTWRREHVQPWQHPHAWQHHERSWP